MKKTLLILGIVFCTLAPASRSYGADFALLQFLNGTWTGSWNNTTFMSTGSISLTLAITGSNNVTATLDLGGIIFGLMDPPAEILMGTVTTVGDTFTFAFTSAVYGPTTIVGTVNAGVCCTFTWDSPMVPAGVMSLNSTGTAQPMTISGNTTINLFGIPSIALANFSLTNPVPVELQTFTID